MLIYSCLFALKKCMICKAGASKRFNSPQSNRRRVEILFLPKNICSICTIWKVMKNPGSFMFSNFFHSSEEKERGEKKNVACMFAKHTKVRHPHLEVIERAKWEGMWFMSNLSTGFHVAVTALSFQRVVCYNTRRTVKASAAVQRGAASGPRICTCTHFAFFFLTNVTFKSPPNQKVPRSITIPCCNDTFLTAAGKRGSFTWEQTPGDTRLLSNCMMVGDLNLKKINK